MMIVRRSFAALRRANSTAFRSAMYRVPFINQSQLALTQVRGFNFANGPVDGASKVA